MIMYMILYHIIYHHGFIFLSLVGPYFIINPIDNQEVVINGTITLTCSAEGFPISSVVWFMNNTVISNGMSNVGLTMNINSSTLIISNANFDDSGIYYCQAVSNEFSDVNVTSTIANITVVGELVNKNVTRHEKTMLVYRKYTSLHHFKYRNFCECYANTVNYIGFSIVWCSYRGVLLARV